MERQPSTAEGQDLTIFGLLISLVGFGISFVPVISYIALAPTGLGLILGLIGFYRARKENGPVVLIQRALMIIVLLAAGAFVWIHFFSQPSEENMEVQNEEKVEQKLGNIEKE